MVKGPVVTTEGVPVTHWGVWLFTCEKNNKKIIVNNK